jgi:hypothetical protein
MSESNALTEARTNFWWVFQLLSTDLGTLDIVALVRHAYVTGTLSAPPALVMDAYATSMRARFGWAEPYLKAALTWCGAPPCRRANACVQLRCRST